jgi:single-stranded DNA-binding protein
VGHVTREPVVKFEGEGVQTCTFTLSITEPSSKGTPYTLYVPMTAWGRAAEACGELHQADLIAVQGKLTWQKRVGKCKQEHSTLVVRVQDIAVLTPVLQPVLASTN